MAKKYELNPLHDRKMQQKIEALVTVSETEPTTPSEGDLWLDITDLGLPGAVVTTTEDLTITWCHKIVEVDASSNDVTITLPTASGEAGEDITITRIDNSAYTVTVEGYGSETIQGELSKTIDSQWDSVNLYSNGSNVRVK